MCINFVCLASPHREHVYNIVLASHIDTSALSDGTYELISDSEGGDLEAQVSALSDRTYELILDSEGGDLEAQVSALSDGTYELIPDSEGGDFEAQVNTAVLTEAQDQSSEEPRAQIITIYCYYLLVHLQFLGFELKP